MHRTLTFLHHTVARDAHHSADKRIHLTAATYPTVEHFLVAAPHIAQPKEHKNFDTWWAQQTA